jgi:hypothetical protein
VLDSTLISDLGYNSNRLTYNTREI